MLQINEGRSFDGAGICDWQASVRRLLRICAGAGHADRLLAGVNSVVAVGVDGQGHLIGAVKVCDHSISQASLSPILPEGQQTTYTYWNRSQPLDKRETWQLDAPVSGKWTLDGSLPSFTPDGVYGFSAQSHAGYSSQFLQFTGSQLAQLSPSDFLVSDTRSRAKAISRADFAKQPCA